MADLSELESKSVAQIRHMLGTVRSEAEALSKSAVDATRDTVGELGATRDNVIQFLRDQQKVIYGVDNRVELFDVTDPAVLADADGVVSVFRSSAVQDNLDGTSTLFGPPFSVSNNLCPGVEAFEDQPTGAFCTGFVVSPNVIATAGHCVNAGTVATTRFVFGYRMANATTPVTVISNADIYSGAAIIGRREEPAGADWALVRVDRKITGHPILPVQQYGAIAEQTPVQVIGHPVGLPAKFADGAAVRDNTPPTHFVANLDTYGGNSGSPVFDSNTHVVEGVLVRGNPDFVATATGCNVSVVCPDSGCLGESCTRTTEFSFLIPGLNPIDLATIFGVQQALHALFYNPGVVDGLDGPNTQAAVSQFQQDNGLTIDGIVGPQTRAALRTALDNEGIAHVN